MPDHVIHATHSKPKSRASEGTAKSLLGPMNTGALLGTLHCTWIVRFTFCLECKVGGWVIGSLPFKNKHSEHNSDLKTQSQKQGYGFHWHHNDAHVSSLTVCKSSTKVRLAGPCSMNPEHSRTPVLQCHRQDCWKEIPHGQDLLNRWKYHV